ncbi:MAG TPA: PEP-CTERM sorting domain-containing protein [Terriglobales bacterium]|jgi:PEP-CTERM motif-containing protein|nr:PEP-CTERM sorting domain-containing protein [Terriglobales bacterium]
MRKILWMALLSLALPLAAWANSSNVVFQNTGGNLVIGGTNAHPTLQLKNSVLTSFTGLNGITHTGTLGTFNFSTTAMTSGSLASSGSFAGGSLTIMGKGTNGVANGVLFQGSFSGPVKWVASFNQSGFGGVGNWTYVLSGTVVGTLSNGARATGGSVQFTFDVPKGQQFSSKVRLNQGVTTVTVPEPGTLGLLGTGLFTLAGLVRRRLPR